MPRAYSYIRMSSDLQLRGDSLRRQTELSRQYATEHGLELVEDFKLEDIGVSAFRGDNITTGALGRFLDAVKAGIVPAGSYLLVESLDRLTRQRLQAAAGLFFDITSSGIHLVTLSDRQVYKAGETDFAQLIVAIAVMHRANEESEIKARRVGAAWAQKRAMASQLKLTRLAPAWLVLSADRRQFHVREDRAAIVRRIFEEAANGHGSNSITRRLNQDGVAPFGRSKGWVQSYVTKILKTRAVLGEHQLHRFENGRRVPTGDPVPDYFPRIVDDELFLRVQAGRRSRGHTSGGRKGPLLRNLFTHLAKCDYCGSPMHISNKGTGPKGGVYLVCAAGRRGLGCCRRGWRYDDFERSFLFFAQEVDLGAILDAAEAGTRKRALEDKLTANTERMTVLERRQEQALELLGTDGMPTGLIAAKLAQAGQELSEARLEREALKAELAAVAGPSETSPDDLLALIGELQDHTQPINVENRHRVATKLREIVASLKLSADGDEPRFRDKVDWLGTIEMDSDFRRDLIAHMEQTSVSHRASQSFTVTFADGVSRKVIVDQSDPLGSVAEVLIDRDNNSFVRDRAFGLVVNGLPRTALPAARLQPA